MFNSNSSFANIPVKNCREGEYLMHQGGQTAGLYFLQQGCVTVVKDDIQIAIVRDPGAVFGDMSVLLDIPHSASVLCLEDSSFHYIADPDQYLQAHPDLLWHMAQILGMRLFNMNQYLVDLKKQYEGHDHLGMVDEILETLMNQQKTRTLKRGDGKRELPDY